MGAVPVVSSRVQTDGAVAVETLGASTKVAPALLLLAVTFAGAVVAVLAEAVAVLSAGLTGPAGHLHRGASIDVTCYVELASDLSKVAGRALAAARALVANGELGLAHVAGVAEVEALAHVDGAVFLEKAGVVASVDITHDLVASVSVGAGAQALGLAVSGALLGGVQEGLQVEGRAAAGQGEEDEHGGHDENASCVAHVVWDEKTTTGK